jgi:hypothetical protein
MSYGAVSKARRFRLGAIANVTYLKAVSADL